MMGLTDHPENEQRRNSATRSLADDCPRPKGWSYLNGTPLVTEPAESEGSGANWFSRRAFAGQLPFARNPDNAPAFGRVADSMF